MKVVILAGGRGQRMGDETSARPKPMIEVGGRPILWHIMKTYSHFGLNEFVVCLGYMGRMIKEYFYNYETLSNDFTVSFDGRGKVAVHQAHDEGKWRVTLVDTGVETLKGGRIKRIERYVDGETFCLTYGDGVADVAIDKLLAYHRSHGRTGTVTAVRPPSRFGELVIEDGCVRRFTEKPQTSTGTINGGFCVFHRRLFDLLSPDGDCDFERGPLEELAAAGELMAYRHDGQWACMDTLRDVEHLNKLWREGAAFWKVWDRQGRWQAPRSLPKPPRPKLVRPWPAGAERPDRAETPAQAVQAQE
jgi:glucose-1-phosphate cytidylyltransferase